MIKKSIDAMGKACPLPVVETKKALVDLVVGDQIEIAVDNFIAVQNLTKMAEQKKMVIDVNEQSKYHYRVTLTLQNQVTQSAAEVVGSREISQTEDNTVVVIASDKMGDGDEKLGRLLMKGFIYALTEQDILPKAVMLYNTGAYLSTQDSDSVADLRCLEEQGVEIITCGTCLNHYGLTEQLEVGEVSNMYVIVEKQMQATKIVRP